jgi:hypothetical protein
MPDLHDERSPAIFLVFDGREGIRESHHRTIWAHTNGIEYTH